MPKTVPVLLVVFLTLYMQSANPPIPSAPSLHPAPEMQKLLNAFSGTWSLELRIEPSKQLPKGGGGSGEEVWRPGPGGLSLIEDYHSKGDDGEISGLGVAWWDESAQRFQITWCDNGTPAGCGVLKGGAKWEDNAVVALDEWEMNGKKFTFKEVFSDITPTSFKQTLYLGEGGGEWKKVETILATRAPSLNQ